MADFKVIIPFIKVEEGKLSKDPNDKAANNPCPFPFRDGICYHTNQGWTWGLFSSIYGNTQAAANRFYAMDTEDWAACFKNVFWDKFKGDDIISQRVANSIANWVFMSGQYWPELDIQRVINHIGKRHIGEDGIFGSGTVTALNESDEELVYSSIISRMKQYFTDIVGTADSKGDNSQDKFLADWLRRVDELDAFNKK